MCAPVSVGNTFQDLPRLRETTDNTERYIQYFWKVTVHLQKVLEVMSTSVYTGLNPFSFIRKHFLHICVRKFAVHLHEVLEVMSTSVYTGLNRSLSAQRLSELTV
jgi:hypothetical protein